jgi:hypothetical protein
MARPTLFSLLNQNITAVERIPANLPEAIALYGRTEQGEPIDCTGWFADYCNILGRLQTELVVVQGCSQVGKSLAALMWLFQMAKQGHRALFVLPTLTALQRNLRVQVGPIARHWGIEPVGTQSWDVGKGTILMGYASTSSGSGSSKEGLASVGGILASISADALLVDEASQISADALAPVFRRLDRGRLPSKPKRLISTPGAGGGIERFARDIKTQLYPLHRCENCCKSFQLDPRQCLFQKTSASGWIEEWSEDDAGNPAIACPNCHAIVKALDPYFEQLEISECAVHLTPLLRGGDPAATIITSMREAMRNTSSSPTDWIQQSLGESSESVGGGNLRVRLSDFDIPAPLESLELIGKFTGIDQGIRSHHLASIVAFTNPAGRLVIKVIEITTTTDQGLRDSLDRFVPDFALGDLAPDRTLMLNLVSQYNQLYPALQKYNLGSFRRHPLPIGSEETDGFELPDKAFPIIFEASNSGRLQFLTPPDATTKQHLTAVRYDAGAKKVIRPKDHNDDRMFALYFAVSAALIWYEELI